MCSVKSKILIPVGNPEYNLGICTFAVCGGNYPKLGRARDHSASVRKSIMFPSKSSLKACTLVLDSCELPGRGSSREKPSVAFGPRKSALYQELSSK
ncbi:hypothetical protein C8R44DRAFT_768106 [Mycena epipterygia]|nr:hypothetical protein C8R44DRAFT_768106 [Mycena epipterygia]